jgi:leucyl-tRNA synthetase
MKMLNINEKMLWPKINEKFLLEEDIKFIIQINGKTKKIITLKKNTSEDLILEKIKNDNKLNEFIKNKNIQKKIFIPNKLINILTN